MKLIHRFCVNIGKQILVPLTTSLYVPGTLADTKNVMVDVGTGFYVDKSTKDAVKFYTDKVEAIGSNLKDLESIVQGKSNNLRVVEDGKTFYNSTIAEHETRILLIQVGQYYGRRSLAITMHKRHNNERRILFPLKFVFYGSGVQAIVARSSVLLPSQCSVPRNSRRVPRKGARSSEVKKINTSQQIGLWKLVYMKS